MAHRSGQDVTGSTSAQVPADGTCEIMRDKITNVILAGRGPEALLACNDRERRFRGQVAPLL